MGTEFQNQLGEIRKAWDGISSIPQDLAPWGYPNLTKSGIANALGALEQLAIEVEKNEGTVPSVISDFVLRQNITNLRQYVTVHMPPNPQPHIPEFLNIIDRIMSALSFKVAAAERKGKPAIQNLARNLATSMSSISKAEELYSQLTQNSEEVVNLAETARELSEEIKAKRETSDAELQALEKTMETIRLHYASAKSDADGVKQMVAELTFLKGELEANKAAQKDIFEKFDGHHVEIGRLIGAASQVGMASSFRSVKLDLERGLKSWLLAFVGAVLVVAETGLLYIAPALNSRDWIEVITKLPLTFPFIWLAWFFAKQYGHTIRLREDYAFKYASAMAFEAHKREAKEIDVDLLKKLLEISIKNFADNPLRIFGNDHHVSPVHETFDSLLKNTSLMDKFRETYQKIVKP